MVCSVSRGRPPAYSARTSSFVRPLSRALPTAVALAGRRVPTQEISRMGWGESSRATYSTLSWSRMPIWHVSWHLEATSFITWVMGASPRSAEKAAPSTSARGPIVYRPVPSSCRRYRRSSSVCTMGNRLLFGASRACDNSVSVKPSSEPDRLSRISKTRAVARCCPCVISCSFHAGALRRRLISPGRSYQMPLRWTSGHAPPPCFPTGGILPDLLLTFSAVLLY